MIEHVDDSAYLEPPAEGTHCKKCGKNTTETSGYCRECSEALEDEGRCYDEE